MQEGRTHDKYGPLRRKKTSNPDRPSGSSGWSNGPSTSGETALVKNKSLKVLMVSSSTDDCEQILDFGCLCHMTPNLYDYKSLLCHMTPNLYDSKSLQNLKEVQLSLMITNFIR